MINSPIPGFPHPLRGATPVPVYPAGVTIPAKMILAVDNWLPVDNSDGAGRCVCERMPGIARVPFAVGELA